jgi:hypothetical protein
MRARSIACRHGRGIDLAADFNGASAKGAVRPRHSIETTFRNNPRRTPSYP